MLMVANCMHLLLQLCSYFHCARAKSGLAQLVETENVVKVIADSADVAMELGTLMFAARFV